MTPSGLHGDVSESAGSDILPTIPPFHSANNARGITMSQCRQSQLFCHATVPTMSSFRSVIITRYHHSIPSQSRPPNSPKEYRSKEHRSDKETVPTLIPWCHEIIPTIPSYWSRIILVKNHACPESYWSRIMPVRNHSDRDIILTMISF